MVIDQAQDVFTWVALAVAGWAEDPGKEDILIQQACWWWR